MKMRLPGFTPARIAAGSTDRRMLFLPLFAGALLAVHLPLLQVASLQQAAIPGLVPGFAIVLGLAMWWPAARVRARTADHWVAVGLATLFLVPSHQLGWLVLLLGSAWLGWRSAKASRARQGMMLIAAAALQTLIVAHLLKWFAGPVLTADAALVAWLLQLASGSGSHVGNVVFGPADHQLLILRGCSSLTNLGNAWLAWYALSRFRGGGFVRRELVFIAVLTLSMLTLNLARLYSMAVDLAWHSWWHSNSGEQLYQLAASALLLLAIHQGLRWVVEERPHVA